MSTNYDAVIIGSGPNGLSAGIALARAGLSVLILEAADTVGGGMRTAELTLEGYRHDICSAVHPMGYLSPYFQQLKLENYGLEWIFPVVSVAHPLDDEPAVLLEKSVDATANNLGADRQRYRRIMQPFANRVDDLFQDMLGPLGIPDSPVLFTQFGAQALLPASLYARMIFKEKRAKALFAGCAAHSILPFDKLFTTALGLIFLASGHGVDWPFPRGGSQSLADALRDCFLDAGGSLQLSTRIDRFNQLPEARAYVFDTDPWQLATIAEDELPQRYKKRLRRYNFGPGVFKIDLALSEPIPWTDPNCLKASTVHVGGTFEEIEASEKVIWNGRHSETPYVLIAQQSQFDETRAPSGKHTCWAYCHVPNGSNRNMSQVIKNQIERFAPGFQDTILHEYTMDPSGFQAYNSNYVGGAVTGGAADISQLFTRPAIRFDPYSTPNKKIYICSASTPPGGGVHGMNGYYAARSVLRNIKSGLPLKNT
ncbi:MAG: NAD(P)/FAD-dependent oxidoreductase [Rhodothermaceae bacterium]|nr:NAD(P)/FAD-dependent oxidoreductase [Rhodothermaceae bacterium]